MSRAPSTRGPDERVLTLADVELVAVGIADRDPFDVPERASARSSGAESDEPCCLGVRVGDMQIEMHAVLRLLRLGNALHEEHGTRVALQRNEAAGLHGDGGVVVVVVGYAISRTVAARPHRDVRTVVARILGEGRQKTRDETNARSSGGS